MKLGTLNTQKSNIGTCPHGLPAGACPICSGGMGSSKKADFSAKPGEMSWNECAAIGRMLRAQKMHRQEREADFQNRISSMAKFNIAISNAAHRAAVFAQMVQSNMPPIIGKPLAIFTKAVVVSGLNLITTVVSSVSNFVQNIGQKFVDISDKLTAVYGEAKAFVAKKAADIVNDVKKKIKSLFAIFETLNADDEDKKIDEAKRTFELKTFIHKMCRKLRNNDENKSAA